ncbi:F-box protein At2g17036 [Cannabis sativa]|uniref:F-box protein At2g17036 n=1 Tax=Cannabis sativa TaxID=3483 RepID=UPI0029CAA1E2|nr:F-box protein At2g17036 [Cannabis sativa]
MDHPVFISRRIKPTLELNPDWTDLPDHILDFIFEKIKTVRDSLIFGTICVKWYQIFMHNRSKLVKLIRHLEPKLLFPIESEAHNSWSVCSINSEHKNVFGSDLLLPSYNKPFSGSSEGWLATLDDNFGFTLFKPFMRTEERSTVHLPPLFPPSDALVVKKLLAYREYYVMKFTTFTPDPVLNPNDFIMVAIYGPSCELAYIRTSKDAAWTHIPSLLDAYYSDVLYYNDTFYALYDKGGLVAFDISEDSSQAQPIMKLIVRNRMTPAEKNRYVCRRYLVESYKGELLQVQRYRESRVAHVTKEFKVFKLSFDQSQWVEINYLEDEALFIGDSTSVSVDTSSTSTQCQSNCIYFVDDKDTIGFDVGPLDCGVYNLKTRSVFRLFSIDVRLFPKMSERIPFWVAPTVFSRGSEAQKGTSSHHRQQGQQKLFIS